MILFSEDLDAQIECGCSEPDCDCQTGMFFLHSRCHPQAGTWAAYERGSNTLSIFCAECGAPVVEVAVASKGRDARLFVKGD